MKVELGNKTALITGATGDLGQATVRLFTKLGAHCLLLARNKDRLDALASELPKDLCTVLSVDLSRPEKISGMLDALNRHVDIIVHCAAPPFQYTKIHNTEDNDNDLQ